MLRTSAAMFDDPSNILTGWCFWTWKKVPNKYPYLPGIDAPAKWKELMAWAAGGWFARKPSSEAAAAATEEFLEAVEFDKKAENAEMLGILGAD